MNLLVFSVAAISAFVGVAIDRMYERWRKNRQRKNFFGSGSEELTMEAGVDPELAREWLQTMKGLTAAVDDNVVRHASEVEKISNDLQHDAGDSQVVVDAAAKLIEANRQLQSELESAKDEIKIQQRQINEYMNEARTDGLTGLANHRAFDQELHRAVEQCTRTETALTLLLIDVDHFKRFNDYHGHQVGDFVLQRVGEILNASVNEMDIAARDGGEEFAAILPGTNQDAAIDVAERIRRRIADDDLFHDGAQLRVTVSIGVNEVEADEQKSELVQRADASLYTAKNAGRNCTSVAANGTHHVVQPAYEVCS